MKESIIEKQDKYILESFIKNHIPTYIREESVDELELMEYYEELFNYTHSLLDGHKNDLNVDSFGMGKAFIFDQAYRDVLLDLTKNSDDINLIIHCYLSLATLMVIQKYAK